MNALTVALYSLCAVFGVILVIEILTPPETRVPAPAAGKAAVPPVVKDDFSLPPLSEFSDIVERPLFVQNRRPIPPGIAKKPATVPAPEASLGGYSLAGVVMAPGQRLAWLRGASDKKLQRLEEGQEIQGWKVKEITNDGATLTRENEEQLLPLVRKTPEQSKKDAQRAAAEALRKSRERPQPPATPPASPPEKAPPASPPTEPPAPTPSPEAPGRS